MVTTKEILDKYQRKIESEINLETNDSKEYTKFKQEMIKTPSEYERWVQSLGNIVSIKLSQKDNISLQNSIDEANLDITPGQAASLSIISSLIIFFIALSISAASYFITGDPQILLVFL